MSKDAFRIGKLANLPPTTEPASPVDGDIYRDENSGMFRFRQNDEWVEITDLSPLGSDVVKNYDSRAFTLNGPYYIVGAENGVDGGWGVLFDMEIIGVMMYNLVSGSSGTTQLDVRRFTGPNSPSGGTSIFSTRPAISSAAPNNAYVFRDVLNGVTLASGTGTTVPVLSITQLNAGDMLTLNKASSQNGGETAGLIIYYRPR
jgi:hypothetical protein